MAIFRNLESAAENDRFVTHNVREAACLAIVSCFLRRIPVEFRKNLPWNCAPARYQQCRSCSLRNTNHQALKDLGRADDAAVK